MTDKKQARTSLNLDSASLKTIEATRKYLSTPISKTIDIALDDIEAENIEPKFETMTNKKVTLDKEIVERLDGLVGKWGGNRSQLVRFALKNSKWKKRMKRFKNP